MKINAIIFSSPNCIEIRETELPTCGKNELICKTHFSFVSPGTELRILSGIKESKDKFPLIPGYSWVGEVVEVGSELKGWKAGDLVTGRNPVPIPGLSSLWGGQASYHRVPVEGYDAVLKLPDQSKTWDYVAAEVAAISWRGASMCFPESGETAVVIGQGLIGAFCALWLVQAGCRVIVLDTVENRLKRSLKWGASAVINPSLCNSEDHLATLIPGGADIVIEASGSRSGVELANKIIRKPSARQFNNGYKKSELQSNPHYWPRLVYQATYSFSIDTVPGSLCGKEGCIVYTPMDRTIDDRLAVIEKIRKGLLPLEDIVSEPISFKEAPWAYKELKENPAKYNTMVFDWR